ncbi:MAG: PLP-dependent transferase [bacterium]
MLGAGINAGTIRLSIGIEDVDDLLEDLSRGIRQSQKATAA